MNDSFGAGETAGRFDAAEAAWLLEAQARTVRAALDVRLPEQLAAWGVAWLVGLGAMWLEVRAQHPYLSLLVAGLMYLFGAALWGVRPMAVLGGWLLVLTAGVGVAGPVAATLLGAVLGGGAFLATAGWLWVGRRGGAGSPAVPGGSGCAR